MILVCPECSTQYDLPSGLPEGGGKVRCTSCEHVWHATDADLIEKAEDAPAAEEGVPAVSPHDDDAMDDLDFNEIIDEVKEEAQEQDEIDSLFDEINEEADNDVQDQSGIDDLFNEPMDEMPEEEPAAEENSQDDIDGLFDEADAGGEDNSQDDIDGLFDEPAPAEGEDNSQDDIDGLFDEPEPQADEGDDNSQDDIDGLFDEEPPSQEVVVQDEELDDPFEGIDKPPSETPEPEPVPKAAKGPFWKRLDQKTVVGWSSYGVVLFFFVLFVFSARVPVVKAVPAMAGVYETLGLGVNVRGVMFTNVQQRWETSNKVLELQLEGEVINLTNKYKKLAPIVFVALSKERREVFRWVADVRKKPLLPGEKAPIQARMPAPPQDAEYLLIRFQ